MATELINMRGSRGRAKAATAAAAGRMVIIGRPSKWGNPFIIGRDGTRADVIEKYWRYIEARPDLLAALGELEGKVLACWCVPDACHGHVLIELIARLTTIPARGRSVA